MTNLEFLAMVAKVDSELAIALAKDSVENPQGKGSITNNFNQGCGVTTVYTGCTIFQGLKKAGKKPTEGETKPSGQKPGNPSPPSGAEPTAVPPTNAEEVVDVEEEDVDEDTDNSPPSPPVDTASTADTSAPNLVL